MNLTEHPLAGVRIVEGASFVAAPFAGMTLVQLGADVIRVDPPGGGSDFHRWPLSPAGTSLFWAGLNKGKRSVTIDHRTPAGHELLSALITAPGPQAGIYLDNMVGTHRLTYDTLRELRHDVIHIHIQGRHDGSPAVDYSINAEYGVPSMTGPAETEVPVNHVLPAWDLVAGMTVATGTLAAVLRRARTGEGANVTLALADVALAGVGSMGWLAEADLAGRPRPRHGNHMYGSFGVDFQTSDGRRVMVVALTEGQWRALCAVTETKPVFAALEQALGADLELEGDRYRLRETIAAVLRPWFAQRDFATVEVLLNRARVLWSPYRDMVEVARVARQDAKSIANEIDDAEAGTILATGSPLRWGGAITVPVRSPRLGEHTDEVLAQVLGLSATEIGQLHDDDVVGAPS